MEEQVWVFGYGSLIWNPGFDYEKSVIGYIKGYSRKLWQGSDQHRGSQENPGRVATLVEDPDSIVWGRAYLVSGDSALVYLNTREGILGGYATKKEPFFPMFSEESTSPLCTLIFIALSNNSLWQGNAPLHSIANQVVSCKGPCGYNAEYIIRLASFMRDQIPDAHVHDPELFTLDIMVRTRLKEKNISIHEVLGETVTDCDCHSSSTDLVVASNSSSSQEFTSRIPNTKSLRCVNIN